MSIIESGKHYKITNEGNGMVLDLSGTDNKTILGWEYHAGGNQQVCSLPYSNRWYPIQPRCPSVDSREAGRRPMDYSHSQ